MPSVELLKVRQVAERLAISESIVYDLVGGRKIRHCRVGNGRGCIRIPADAIGEYLESVTIAPAAMALIIPRARANRGPLRFTI